jgi:hypothetical protein
MTRDGEEWLAEPTLVIDIIRFYEVLWNATLLLKRRIEVRRNQLNVGGVRSLFP